MKLSRIFFVVFMAACIAIFCLLGTWQVKRLQWKENLIANINREYAHDISPIPITEARIKDLQRDQYIRGTYTGRVDFTHAFDLMGQIDHEKQTSHKIVPFHIADKLTVLIDFGPDFKDLPKQTSQKVTLTGLLKNAQLPNRFTPDNIPSENIWYSINLMQLEIPNSKPLIILPEHTPWKEYPAQKPELRNAHLQYAIFWFTMAVLVTGLTFIFLRRK